MRRMTQHIFITMKLNKQQIIDGTNDTIINVYQVLGSRRKYFYEVQRCKIN